MVSHENVNNASSGGKSEDFVGVITIKTLYIAQYNQIFPTIDNIKTYRHNVVIYTAFLFYSDTPYVKDADLVVRMKVKFFNDVNV